MSSYCLMGTEFLFGRIEKKDLDIDSGDDLKRKKDSGDGYTTL